MKIAVVGYPAVGKDTLSDYIARTYKLTHVSSGDLLRSYVSKHHLGSLDRRHLQTAGNKLRAEKGGDYLVGLALEATPDNIVLSGLRAIDEVVTFKERGGFVIALTAPLQLRYELAKKRGRIDEMATLADFQKLEEGEDHRGVRTALNVNEVVALAHATIVNDGTLEQLFTKTKKIIDGFRAA